MVRRFNFGASASNEKLNISDDHNQQVRPMTSNDLNIRA
jgi:hypothetical protein